MHKNILILSLFLIFTTSYAQIINENFEGSSTLSFEVFNNDEENHGTFTEGIENPAPGGINESSTVANYIKGNSSYSAITAVLPFGIDLSEKPQINMQVLAPAGASTVLVRLFSQLSGSAEASADIASTSDWQELNFNFLAFQNITDFQQITIYFDPGNSTPGASYFIDNITQGESTGGPCIGVDPVPNIYDDFECQRNVSYGVGGDNLTVIENPDPSDGNNSSHVGQYADALDQWSALVFQTGNDLNLSTYNQFHMKIWAPFNGPLLFKLEGGSSPPVEIWREVESAEEWVEYVVDFSPYIGQNHGHIAVFFNAGQIPLEMDLYFIDDIFWERNGYSGCINDYETEATSISNFVYFANGHLESEGKTFEVHDNPNPTGINPSPKVGEFVKASDALPFAGMYADLDAPIVFGNNKTAKAKVLMDHIGNFALKLEDSPTGAPPVEVPIANTIVGEWEELTWDFSAVSDDANYMRLTVFFDLGIEATGQDVTSYFDEIVIGDGACSFVNNVFKPVDIDQLSVYPNPVTDLLVLDNLEGIDTLKVLNLQGQELKVISTEGTQKMELEVSEYRSGVYFLSAYNKAGRLLSKAKIIKQN